MAKFILGGRMGDLIHMMYVVKNTPGEHDLYITDRRDLHSDGFLYPLDKTIEEIRPILMYQDCVRTVQPYNDEPDCINLNLWRRKAYTASWTNLLSDMFGVRINGDAWMKSPPGVNYLTLVHCSLPPARRGNWDGVNLHNATFMGSINEFESFNRRELVLVTPHSLKNLFEIVGSCRQFIGNQSLPLAVACALNVPRLGVLNPVDQAAYVGEDLIFKNFSYVL